MSYQDYYATLGVSRTASADELQRAYRTLARKFHPDVSKEHNAEIRFKEINAAYEVLKDAEKRKLYDRYGESWKAVSEGRAPPSDANRASSDFGEAGFHFEDAGDLESLFEHFFGGEGQRGAARSAYAHRTAHVGADQEAVVRLSVASAFRGGQQEFLLNDPNTGQRRRYKVRVPAGVQPGQKIRLAGQGSPGFGQSPAGDLYLLVELESDARFRLDGADVYTTLPVSPWEAALGVKATLNTLDGNVRVTVPKGSSTGTLVRLKGRGYPTAHGPRGDLYAELRIQMPPSLNKEEQELVQQLASVSRYCPRAEDVQPQPR